ncbi:ATP-binding protein [candidate division KSB1 bacterium]
MNIFTKIYFTFFPAYLKNKDMPKEKIFRYRRLWLYSASITAMVALAPLIIMTVMNLNLYQGTFEDEIKSPIITRISTAKRNLEFNLAERQAALSFIINNHTLEELSDNDKLSEIFFHLRSAFGGFVDLGLIDSQGNQLTYSGPYDLSGRNYLDQDWFNAITLHDSYVSEMFMGFRGFPHFIITVKYVKTGGDFYVLRATIDAEFINRQIQALEIEPSSDAFLINREGILQTPSKYYGNTLEKCPLEVPPFTNAVELNEFNHESGGMFFHGYAYIEESPFIFMALERHDELMKNWFTLRSNLLSFLGASIILVILVIFWSSTRLVHHIQEAEDKREKVIHDLEYTNKMASIGRLAAGVAHEINNPLAIINQKAGLLKDIVEFDETFPQREKLNGIIDSVLQSVDRCGAITHRFLGFAKRMDLQAESIELGHLIQEVLGFLGREAAYRNIEININKSDDVPTIESDRGQLQQVFLNIINNAFAAMKENGILDVSIRKIDDYSVSVTVEDTGKGIAKENLEHIFEPFFTTKKEGTGLGLSITYGIVKKLGGDIQVESNIGKGTQFEVILPVNTGPKREI